MYDKDSIYFACTVVIIIAFIAIINFIFAGCQSTTGQLTESEKQLISDFARFEESFGAIEQRIDSAQELAGNISNEATRALYLFEQYDSAVREYREEIDRLRNYIKELKKEVH